MSLELNCDQATQSAKRLRARPIKETLTTCLLHTLRGQVWFVSKVFYQNSEVSFAWKFQWIWYYDRKDSYHCPSQTQHQGTPLTWGFCFWPAAASAQPNPLPHKLLFQVSHAWIPKHAVLLGRLRHFNHPLPTLTIHSDFTVPSLKTCPPPPVCPVLLQR